MTGIASLAQALASSPDRQGGVAGIQRISRHLWRMCAAFFTAAASFFINFKGDEK